MFLAEAVWAESDDSAALHRATAELFAQAAQIGSDTFAAFLITQVMKHLAGTPSPQKCALNPSWVSPEVLGNQTKRLNSYCGLHWLSRLSNRGCSQRQH